MAMLAMMGGGGGGLFGIALMGASAVGSYIMNKPTGKDPSELNDLRISSSTYGRGIALAWGTVRCSGNMIWATDLQEHFINKKGKDVTGKKKDSKKGSAKKGGHSTYHANFAMAMCEGPVEDVLRVWADQALIYDKLGISKFDPNNPDANVVMTPGFPEASFNNRSKGQSKTTSKKSGKVTGTFAFRFYSGSEEQLQDPYMVGKQGSTKVPAFRGLCYLMFQDFALGDFGNRIPTITAEVVWKKKPQIVFGMVTNLPSPPTASFDSEMMFFDATRSRMYVYHPTMVFADAILRVFDMQSSAEIQRVLVSDIAAGRTFFSPIGLSGNGDLVFRFGAGNSCPIAFVDPQSFAVRKTFGYVSSDIICTDTNIPTGVKSCQLISSDADGTIDIGTAVVTIFCDVVLFDGGGNHVGHANNGFGLLGARDGTVIAAKTTNGTALLLKYNPVLGAGCIDKLFSAGKNINGKVAPFIKTHFYQADYEPLTDTTVIISDPFSVVNVEAVCLMEQCVSSDPTRNGIWAVKLDQETGDIIWRARATTIAADGPGLFGPPNCGQLTPIITSNNFYWRSAGDGDTVYMVDWRQQVINTITLPANAPVWKHGQLYWPSADAILELVVDPADSEEKWSLCFLDRLQQVPVSQADIMVDIADRCGIDSTHCDTTKLNDTPILGYLMETPRPARTIVDELSRVYMFDVCESDYKLKFVSRGQAPIVTIPQDDLGKVPGSGVATANDFFAEKRVQEVDLPMLVNVTFTDPTNYYLNGTAHYKRPANPMPVIHTKEKIDVNLPICMHPDQAKQLAQIVCLSTWAERTTHDYILPWTYVAYDPTDVATFLMNDGLTFIDRFMKTDFGADYKVDARGVSQVQDSYTSTATQSAPGGTIFLPGPKSTMTRAFAFDVPFLHDNDVSTAAGYEFYFGVGGMLPGLAYAGVTESIDGGSYTGIGATSSELVWGTVWGTIPPPANGDYATDTTTTILLFPTHDFSDMYTWESVLDADWPNDSNMMVVGREVILFKNVTINANGTIVIDTLIRGHRGTEAAAYVHTDGEYFNIMDAHGLMTHQEPIDTANKVHVFQSQSNGLLGYLSFKDTRTMTAATLKPWAPNKITRTEAAGNITMTWQRRTRYSGQMLDLTGTVPLNEQAEQYEVYILAAPFDQTIFDAALATGLPGVGTALADGRMLVPTDRSVVLRAFTGLTLATIAETGADLTADGLSITSTLNIVVFQISATIGRGFPGATSLLHRYYP